MNSELVKTTLGSLTTEKIAEFRSPFMNVKEAAAFTKFSEKKIYRLCREGLIPCKKEGGQYRFHKDKIEQWLKGELDD